MERTKASLLETFRADIGNLERPSFNNLKIVAAYRLALWQEEARIMTPIRDDWRKAFIEAAGKENEGVAASAFDSAWSEKYLPGQPAAKTAEAENNPPHDIDYLDVESCLIEIETIIDAQRYALQEVDSIETRDPRLEECSSILRGLNTGLTNTVEKYFRQFNLA